MSVRRQARELALQMLFPSEFQHPEDLMEDSQTNQDAFEARSYQLVKNQYIQVDKKNLSSQLSSPVLSYAQKLVFGICRQQADIDQIIARNTTSWRLDRMVSVDRLILRIGTYEIKYLNIDPAVVINETLEIAKKYSTLDSSRFINGVLDSILKKDSS